MALAIARNACATKAAVSRRSTVKVSAFQVTLQMPQGQSRTLEVPKGQSVMDAIESSGMEAPHLCRSGHCGACAGKIVSGKYAQDGQGLLEQHQLEAGFLLMCCTYPQTDCTIATHQEENLHVYGA